MPTYEYLCSKCGEALEIEQRITEDALKKCPKCGKMGLERQISGGNFVLKGSGWYKDLYSSSKPGAARTDNQRIDRLTKAIDDDKKKSSSKKDDT